jgi:hypothetical protein
VSRPRGSRHKFLCVERVNGIVLHNKILLGRVTFQKASLRLELQHLPLRLHGKQWHLKHDLFPFMTHIIILQIAKQCNKFLMSGEQEIPGNYSARDLLFTQFHYDLTTIYFSFVRVDSLSLTRLSDIASKPCTSVKRLAPSAGNSLC